MANEERPYATSRQGSPSSNEARMYRDLLVKTGLIGLLLNVLVMAGGIVVLQAGWVPVLFGGLFMPVLFGMLLVIALLEMPMMIYAMREMRGGPSVTMASAISGIGTINIVYVTFPAVYATAFVLTTANVPGGLVIASLSLVRALTALLLIRPKGE